MQLPPIIYGTAWKKQQTVVLVYQAITLVFMGDLYGLSTSHMQDDLTITDFELTTTECLSIEKLLL